MYALSLLVLYSAPGDFCPDALVFRSQQGTLNCDMNEVGLISSLSS